MELTFDLLAALFTSRPVMCRRVISGLIAVRGPDSEHRNTGPVGRRAPLHTGV